MHWLWNTSPLTSIGESKNFSSTYHSLETHRQVFCWGSRIKHFPLLSHRLWIFNPGLMYGYFLNFIYAPNNNSAQSPGDPTCTVNTISYFSYPQWIISNCRGFLLQSRSLIWEETELGHFEDNKLINVISRVQHVNYN